MEQSCDEPVNELGTRLHFQQSRIAMTTNSKYESNGDFQSQRKRRARGRRRVTGHRSAYARGLFESLESKLPLAAHVDVPFQDIRIFVLD